MQLVQRGGLTWYTFTGPGLDFANAIFTRLGGVSRPPFAALNLGGTVGDEPSAVSENLRRALAPFGLAPEQVVSPHQVHGRRVVQVGPEHAGTIVPEADALITAEVGLGLLLRFADCTPVLFYDPARRAVGLAHAGWRGTALGVAPATVSAMRTAFGSRPEDLWVGIGPAIGPDHYAVGEEVVEAVGAAFAERREGQWYLDMPGALAAQLLDAGVRRVERSNLCTACRTDLWYSHRAERGKTGRFGAMVALKKCEEER